jgi:hypothetical protein
LLAALAAVAGVGRVQLALDLERDGAAEAGSLVHAMNPRWDCCIGVTGRRQELRAAPLSAERINQVKHVAEREQVDRAGAEQDHARAADRRERAREQQRNREAGRQQQAERGERRIGAVPGRRDAPSPSSRSRAATATQTSALSAARPASASQNPRTGLRKYSAAAVAGTEATASTPRNSNRSPNAYIVS